MSDLLQNIGAGDHPGVELAAARIARVRQKGALSPLEAEEFSRLQEALDPAEEALYSAFLDRGFCVVCDHAGIISPAGHGPEGDLCAECAEVLGEGG